MNSAVSAVFSESAALPRSFFWGKLLGFSPVRAGYYGTDSRNPLRLCGNHLPTLRRLFDTDSETSLLALETGGFSLIDYLALYPLSRTEIEAWLTALPAGDRPARLLVPHSLAERLALQPESTLVGSLVEWVADDSSALSTPLGLSLKIAAGQAVFWVLPLLIFGWQALLWGLAALFGGALLLGLTWRLGQFPAFLRGLLVGVILALLAGLTLVFAFGQAPAGLLFPLLGLVLAPSWLSLLLLGGKP